MEFCEIIDLKLKSTVDRYEIIDLKFKTTLCRYEIFMLIQTMIASFSWLAIFPMDHHQVGRLYIGPVEAPL